MKRSITLLLLMLMLFIMGITPASAQAPVVKAILFYSPFCGHCHKVINEDIPPLSAQHNQEVVWKHVPEPTREETGGVPTFVALEGDALQILFINTTTPIGSELFGQAIEMYAIPEPAGVPTLIVGDAFMVGSVDIPAQFPGLIADGLQADGIEWPAVPGLEDQIDGLTPIDQETAGADQTQDEAPEAEQAESGQPVTQDDESVDKATLIKQPDLLGVDRSQLSVRERVLLDPVGNTLSILILIGMLLSVIGIGARWISGPHQVRANNLHWLLLLLIFVGVGVAAYLTFVESTGTEAVCGPVGDCNTVQGSRYALLFGRIPVGALGLAGYAGLLIAWLLSRFSRPAISNRAVLAFFIIALLGTLFSIYLTFLEPFVIGATCVWCLSSAVIMTGLLLLSTDAARSAYRELSR